MKINLIFIHIGNKKIPYLNDSIKQALIFNQNINVYLISNKKTFQNISSEIKEKIIFKDTNKIVLKKNHITFIKNSLLDSAWYKGFWKFTTERFFYLQNLIENENLKNIFHVENDLMIYFDIRSVIKTIKKNYNIGLLLDSNEKAIPSFLYFKDLKNINKLVYFFEKQHSFINMLIGLTFGKIYSILFDKYFFNNNDMDVLFKFYLANLKNKKIDILPSATPSLKKNKQYSKNINICKHYKKFGGIFDPASFGGYLDGFDTDPIFKNVTLSKKKSTFKSAVDVTKYKVYFKVSNRKKIPYILDNNKVIKLLTLHIHSKKLNKFLSK
jgi:hypothetical protein